MFTEPLHASLDSLEAGLPAVLASPRDAGTLALIVRRPATDARDELETGELNVEEGLAGDTWRFRSSSHTPDRSPHPGRQLTLMNVRLADLVAGAPERRALAGDQLYIDLDLSEANLPPGTRLAVGEAVIEVTAELHTGCAKFKDRFGRDALRLVSTPEGRALRLRGLYARVVTPGRVRVGDTVRKLA